MSGPSGGDATGERAKEGLLVVATRDTRTRASPASGAAGVEQQDRDGPTRGRTRRKATDRALRTISQAAAGEQWVDGDLDGRHLRPVWRRRQRPGRRRRGAKRPRLERGEQGANRSHAMSYATNEDASFGIEDELRASKVGSRAAVAQWCHARSSGIGTFGGRGLLSSANFATLGFGQPGI